MDDESKNILDKLIKTSKVASLGTSKDNIPYISMVSYSVSDDSKEYYILISQLAEHTQNILNNPNVSLMICQPETEKSNPQTLARVSLNGKAELVERNSDEFEEIKKNYLTKNPKATLYF
ncbi:MAG: pyridoxamine 5'-phosphate oxidase family protein, partial [Ignavibacteriae bacterium]|nr:pyridoxamine 5'-phosphate oxidase family protein [Ignavibacteriota bacterium]